MSEDPEDKQKRGGVNAQAVEDAVYKLAETMMSENAQQEPTWIDVNARMTDEVAWELAQFCKRSTFDQFYELTEAHLPVEERKRRAHLMISGIDAVTKGLREKGYAPR